jgi:hypothetical protein
MVDRSRRMPRDVYQRRMMYRREDGAVVASRELVLALVDLVQRAFPATDEEDDEAAEAPLAPATRPRGRTSGASAASASA